MICQGCSWQYLGTRWQVPWWNYKGRYETVKFVIATQLQQCLGGMISANSVFLGGFKHRWTTTGVVFVHHRWLVDSCMSGGAMAGTWPVPCTHVHQRTLTVGYDTLYFGLIVLVKVVLSWIGQRSSPLWPCRGNSLVWSTWNDILLIWRLSLLQIPGLGYGRKDR